MKADKYLETCTAEEREYVFDRLLDQPMYEVVWELLSYIGHEPIKKLVKDYRKKTK